jgi:methionyl-tRNA formyltransferase
MPQKEIQMTQEKVLFLGPEDSPLIPWLQEHGEEVIQTADKLSAQAVAKQEFSFLVSYGYRHILRKDILDIFPNKAINLHISYLPWNRGADPNFWSFVEDTPKGVTIHYLDEGVDTGDIIVQQEIEFDSDLETLATSYEKLQAAIQDLFKKNWQNIKSEKCQRQKQIGNGSTHKVKDKEGLSHLLTNGWNTVVSVLEEYAAETQMSQQFWEKYDSEIEEIRKQKKA